MKLLSFEAIPSVMKEVLRRSRRPTTIVECGAHDGATARQLVSMIDEEPWFYYAFEPDPRNLVTLQYPDHLPKGVILIPKAVGGYLGEATLFMSQDEWTYSSSIRRPKEHLNVYPWVRFEKTSQVPVTTLDYELPGLGHVDLLWADIQGAERDMVAGGPETLKKTSFLFLEQDRNELYEGMWRMPEMERELSSWGIAALFPNDVLFYNKEIFPVNPLE